ncbi:lytic transglycosylase domain-containing protein [Brevibacillus choshinensis]|uniref:Lytic transglycosylase domain-containing protein n=1 Tax=Brevibacillus choshinensis TaxID=54911 RepID=A0ABX7FUG7_BRECH|nr:lytic transglycosylase domain-containing protein [Brevibacillus choshinensis]QRG69903.1 lytic transglycosylase domain-containing protein [Brevibacillus choshinensis]
MNVPVSLQPYLNQLTTSYGASTAQAALPAVDEGMFSDVLQAELAAGQRVISAEEIIAELDGSPEWHFPQQSVDRHLDDSNVTNGSTSGRAAHSTTEVLEKIDRMARSIGVDKNLVREVVRAESNFNPNAVSRAGAKGLMQLMDPTARAMNVRNAYNPDENLAGGTKYLKSLLDRYDGNVKVALAAYNAGPGRISRLGIDSDTELEERYDQLPQETQRYVEKIMNRLQSDRTS